MLKLRKLFAAVLWFVAAVATAQEAGMPLVPTDKDVRIGKLDNGLTYYIRYNNWPENKANFYIAQRVGSIQEEDDQRGLAHFLEHMAFNGTEHFPDSTLLEYTRSLGVEFGSNLNAYTSIDQTVYRICDVPTKRATAVDSCVLILKDWSVGLTLADKEIDKERGVIHQEWQLRESPNMRIYQKLLPKLYPNSKYGERLPIGLMEVVDNFPYEALRKYYRKWYRPDNQAIIVVGDVDVAHVEAEIKRLWAGVTVPEDAPKVYDELVGDNETPIYASEKDKEQPFSIVALFMKHEPVPDDVKPTVAYLFDQYIKEQIAMMFNQRLHDAVLQPDCPFVGAEAGDGQYLLSKTMDAFSLSANAKEGKDVETLSSIYREAQRVKRHGFTPGEFDRTKEEYLSRLEKRYNNRNKIENAEFATQYRENFLEKTPIPSVEDEYEIMKTMVIPSVTLDMVNGYAAELISDGDRNLVSFIMQQEKEGKTYLTETDMADAVNGVRTETIEAFVDNVKNEPLVAPGKMPKKGKIKKTVENKTLGYKELTLSNGARVILKKTDFKDDEILFQAEAKGGKSLYDGNFSTLKLLDTGLAASGLGNFSNNELTKALYGKQASVSTIFGNYYTILNGNAVPKDLETLMQLIYLHFTDIRKDEDAYRSVMSQVELRLKNKNLNPDNAMSDSITATIMGHEPRSMSLEASDVEQADYDLMLSIASERFANASDFVFYFVGNFDEAAIRPLIEQYIASLPGKKQKAGWRQLPGFAEGMVSNNFKREMQTPKATAFELWHMPTAYTLENNVLADAAGQVLSMVYLKDIREDASAAYSVFANGILMLYGDAVVSHLEAYCPMDPKKTELALELLNEGMKRSAVTIDADKVEKVKENMQKNIEADNKRNAHWMGVIASYLRTGVDMHTGYKDAVASLTAEKISEYLKQLVSSGNHIEVVMTPAE